MPFEFFRSGATRGCSFSQPQLTWQRPELSGCQKYQDAQGRFRGDLRLAEVGIRARDLPGTSGRQRSIMLHNFTMLGARSSIGRRFAGAVRGPGPLANEEKSRLARLEMALGVKLAKA